MNSAKWMGPLLLCVGCSLAGPAQAEGEGWYAVVFGGQSKASGIVSQSTLDSAIGDAFASVGFAVVSGSSSLDDTDTAFGATLGYKVTENFATELSYVDLGSPVDYQSTNTVTDGVSPFNATTRAEATASGPVLSFLGILPIGERFDVYGRAGLALMDTEARVNVSVNGVSASDSASTRRSNAMYGIGGEFIVNKRFGIRAEWNRYAKIGSEDITGEGDIDMLNLALRVNFR
jgi:opacity protein-like surface antigen